MPLRKEAPPQNQAPPPSGVEKSSVAGGSSSPQPVTVAIQGCCHGELGKIYDECSSWEGAHGGKKIELLICCGDFQSLRSRDDFSSITMPEKYLALGDFHKYHNGTRVAPIPTIFVGGNHEASNVLWEHYYGGEVAPNIYYIGHSGVVLFKGLRIAGLSGIFKGHDYQDPYPCPPYDKRGVYSAYHVRELEVKRLLWYSAELDKQREQQHPPASGTTGGGTSGDVGKVDIMLSHDWPTEITQYGDLQKLLQVKSHLEEDIQRKRLGNPKTMPLVKTMKPSHWFAAHYHVKFQATVPHLDGGGQEKTQFLALDKCVYRYDKNKIVEEPEAEPGGEESHQAHPHHRVQYARESFIEVMDITPSSTTPLPAAAVVATAGGEATNAKEAVYRDPLWVEVIKDTHRFVTVVHQGSNSTTTPTSLAAFPTRLTSIPTPGDPLAKVTTSAAFEDSLGLHRSRGAAPTQATASVPSAFAKFFGGGRKQASTTTAAVSTGATKIVVVSPVPVAEPVKKSEAEEEDGFEWEEDVG